MNTSMISHSILAVLSMALLRSWVQIPPGPFLLFWESTVLKYAKRFNRPVSCDFAAAVVVAALPDSKFRFVSIGFQKLRHNLGQCIEC